MKEEIIKLIDLIRDEDLNREIFKLTGCRLEAHEKDFYMQDNDRWISNEEYKSLEKIRLVSWLHTAEHMLIYSYWKVNKWNLNYLRKHTKMHSILNNFGNFYHMMENDKYMDYEENGFLREGLKLVRAKDLIFPIYQKVKEIFSKV